MLKRKDMRLSICDVHVIPKMFFFVEIGRKEFFFVPDDSFVRPLVLPSITYQINLSISIVNNYKGKNGSD